MPLLLVEWIDATAHAGESGSFAEGAEKFGHLATCEDIGFLVRITKNELVLATSRCIEDDDFRGANTIPRAWITGLEILQRSGG